MMYFLAFALAVGIVCILLVAGGNRFDDYDEEECMDHEAFYKLVVALRNKQKEYFRTRTQSALRESKALEKRVDDEIKRVENILKAKSEPKLF